MNQYETKVRPGAMEEAVSFAWLTQRENGRDLTQSYDKSPDTYRKIQKATRQHKEKKTQPKTSITQQLQTDLGRSVGVTTATPLVWLNWLTSAQPSH